MLNKGGSLGDTLVPPVQVVPLSDEDHNTFWSVDSSAHLIVVPKYCSRKTLNATQKCHLLELYSELYGVSRSMISEISTVCLKYAHISMYNKVLGTHQSNTASSSIVFVYWKYGLFGLSDSFPERVARIESFYEHAAVVSGHTTKHMLANLSFFKVHPKHSNYGKPVSVYYHDLYESDGIYSLIPVQFICSRCVSLIDKIDGESVLFTTPVIDF